MSVLAARMGDSVGSHASVSHTLAGIKWGKIAGAVAGGVVLGLALLAAGPLCATGVGAVVGVLLVASAAAAAVALVNQGGKVGGELGEAQDRDEDRGPRGPPCSKVTNGCPTVLIENRRAARIDDPVSHGAAKVCQGSKTVFIGNKHAARHEDDSTCSGIVIEHASYTRIGGPKVGGGQTERERLHAEIEEMGKTAETFGWISLGALGVAAAVAAGAGMAAFVAELGVALVVSSALGIGGGTVGGWVGAAADRIEGDTDHRWEKVGTNVGAVAGAFLTGRAMKAAKLPEFVKSWFGGPTEPVSVVPRDGPANPSAPAPAPEEVRARATTGSEAEPAPKPDAPAVTSEPEPPKQLAECPSCSARRDPSPAPKPVETTVRPSPSDVHSVDDVPPELRTTGQEPAYRGSRSTPEELRARGGFTRSGSKDLSLEEHVNPPGTLNTFDQWVSTSKGTRAPMEPMYSGMDGYVYEIQKPGGIDVNKLYGTPQHGIEEEITFESVPWENIKGWYKVTGGPAYGTPRALGEFVPNPDFHPVEPIVVRVTPAEIATTATTRAEADGARGVVSDLHGGDVAVAPERCASCKVDAVPSPPKIPTDVDAAVAREPTDDASAWSAASTRGGGFQPSARAASLANDLGRTPPKTTAEAAREVRLLEYEVGRVQPYRWEQVRDGAIGRRAELENLFAMVIERDYLESLPDRTPAEEKRLRITKQETGTLRQRDAYGGFRGADSEIERAKEAIKLAQLRDELRIQLEVAQLRDELKLEAPKAPTEQTSAVVDTETMGKRGTVSELTEGKDAATPPKGCTSCKTGKEPPPPPLPAPKGPPPDDPAPRRPASPRPLGVVNVGGEAEVEGAIDLNRLDEDALRRPLAQIKAKSAGLVQADMTNMPFADNSRDAIIGNKVPMGNLAKRGEPPAFMVDRLPPEAFRVLKPGGTIKLFSQSGGAEVWLEPLRRAGFTDVKVVGGYAVGTKP